jgi:uncharacterized membrane protein YkoI
LPWASRPTGPLRRIERSSRRHHPTHPITLADAERIALAHIPGGTIEDIERDHRLDKPVFGFDVRAQDGREHELVIARQVG